MQYARNQCKFFIDNCKKPVKAALLHNGNETFTIARAIYKNNNSYETMALSENHIQQIIKYLIKKIKLIGV